MTFVYPVLFIGLAALVCARLLANWSRMSKAPGPALAGATDLWRAYQQYNGKLRGRLLELHAKHGPIVRYGVRSISISDPEVIGVVYGSRAGFVTADSYKVLVGIQNGKEVPSLVSTRDETRHGALRRSVANAFTPAAVLDYEGWIDDTLAELLAKLRTKTGTFDLASLLLYYVMDAAGRFSFGEPLGCLAAEADVGGSIQMIRDRFNHWGWWSSLPGPERLVFRNPVAVRQKRQPSSMAGAAFAKLRARSAGGGGGRVDLLQRFVDASQEHPTVLDTPGTIGMLMSTISGAGDTTAVTMTAVFYFLLKHPRVLRKLEDELAQADLDEIPTYAQVNRLPYLHAVIRESMRLFPPITFPLERLVPAGGVTIAGMFFPEGTSVGCLPSAVHMNVRIYGDDAHAFRPERWLTSDQDQLRLMEASHMGFSRGRRVCLGQHIAVLQMKKAIPALLMKFKLSLVRPDASLDADFSPTIAVLKPLYVHCEAKQ